nr:MAG TPA: hypothetical protein [Caudoviricetes sp.]
MICKFFLKMRVLFVLFVFYVLICKMELVQSDYHLITPGKAPAHTPVSFCVQKYADVQERQVC